MDSHGVDHKLSPQDRRRAIYTRVTARFAAKGILLNDPTFHQIAEHWIADDITIPDAIILWSDIRSRRPLRSPDAPNLISPPAAPVSINRTELLAHIAEIAGSWLQNMTPIESAGEG